MQLKKRQDIPLEETWNLQDLYPSEKAYEDAIQMLDKEIQIFSENQTPLEGTETISQRLKNFEELLMQINLLASYASLYTAVDISDQSNRERMGKMEMLLAAWRPKLTAFENQVKNLPEASLRAVIEAYPNFSAYLEGILRSIPHKLSEQTEMALAYLSPAIDLPYDLYQQAKLADLSFEPFCVADEEYPLSFVLFENKYQYEPNLELRRAAFKSFSKRLSSIRNTVATAYIGQVRTEKALAELRGYPSVFDYLLFNQRIPRSIYDQHLDTIMEKLPAIMQKYARLLAQVHQIPQMHYSDLKLPLDPSYVPAVSIAEAKTYAREALAVMGNEYMGIVNTMLDERGVDWAQNLGKSTGGFCASPYGAPHSFILLSFTNLLSNVFTLVHELGHAGHFGLANKYQNMLGTEPSVYFIEAPSTINEVLLANELVQRNSDPRYQRFVFSALIGNTYYHNYVTHFIEAYYQREVYRAIERGEGLTAESLSAVMKATLQKFWGDAVEIDDDAALTWMRQPHYYMGLYPYTYSAGLSIGTKMAKRIREEGQPAVEDWLNALKAGGTLSPIELAQIAGVDINQKDVLLETMDYINYLVDQCIDLSAKLS